MAQSSIAHLLAAWSDIDAKPKTDNLVGLLQSLRDLSQSPQDEALRKEIREGSMALARGFHQATLETEADIKKLPDYSPLLDLYDTTLNSYEMSQKVIDHIRTEPSALDESELAQVIADLEVALEEMRMDQEQWADWLNGKAPRCSRCGYTDTKGGSCPDCKVDLLIPDPRPQESSNNTRAVLGPEYVQAYQAYAQLQDGHLSLGHFYRALQPLQKSIHQWDMLVSQGGLAELSDGDLTASLSASVERSVNGLHQLLQAQETRRWVDINQGWDTVFQAAVALQQDLPRLHRAMGDEESARNLEQSYRTRDTA